MTAFSRNFTPDKISIACVLFFKIFDGKIKYKPWGKGNKKWQGLWVWVEVIEWKISFLLFQPPRTLVYQERKSLHRWVEVKSEKVKINRQENGEIIAEYQILSQFVVESKQELQNLA